MLLGGKEERSAFLQKSSKKLLQTGLSLSGAAEAKLIKVFCFCFSKKKSFLPLALTPMWPHQRARERH
jgi:hypothetical protein